jgi:hypothetical protein
VEYVNINRCPVFVPTKCLNIGPKTTHPPPLRIIFFSLCNTSKVFPHLNFFALFLLLLHLFYLKNCFPYIFCVSSFFFHIFLLILFSLVTSPPPLYIGRYFPSPPLPGGGGIFFYFYTFGFYFFIREFQEKLRSYKTPSSTTCKKGQRKLNHYFVQEY